MRAFSLFVSALALANLSQATPLVDTEFAQLDAELELEGVITKPNAVKLGEIMDKWIGIATDGVPSETKQVKDTYIKDTMKGSIPTEYMRTETTIDIDRDGLKADAKNLKKSNQMFTRQVDKTTKFAEWNKAATAAIGPYKEVVGGDSFSNYDPKIQAVKKLASSMAKCLDNSLCLESFAKYAAKVHSE